MVMLCGGIVPPKRKGFETTLDLNKVNIFLFQNHPVFDTILESIIRGIQEGDKIPRVPLVTKDNLNYFLADIADRNGGILEGGHHRIVAHYIEKKPLPVEIYGSEYLAESTVPTPLNQVEIITDTRGILERRMRKAYYRTI